MEIIDLRTLRLIDWETIQGSLEKTNRLIVVEEGPKTGGWAGEVLALAVEESLEELDDAWRLTTPDRPIPYSPPLEDAFLPGPEAIARSIRSAWQGRTGCRPSACEMANGGRPQVEVQGPNLVGPRLRVERERQRIGLRELARRVNVSASLISQVELGKATPSVGTLYAIVNELGMSLDELFFDSGGAPADDYPIRRPRHFGPSSGTTSGRRSSSNPVSAGSASRLRPT